MSSSDDEAAIDREVWAAHTRLDLAILTEIDAAALAAWGDDLYLGVRGHWHEGSGVLAERLDVGDEEWARMVKAHRPAPAASLGDSSVDLVPYVLAVAGLLDLGEGFSPATAGDLDRYIDRGRAVGCHCRPTLRK